MGYINTWYEAYHHEYKIMGLAPFANSFEKNKTYEIFRKIFKLNKKNYLLNTQINQVICILV